jgi:uncharacterized protein with HEPN domain
VSRRDRERLEDVLVATAAITVHMGRGSLDDGLVFDAVRVRLIEIGEAVKGIAPELLAEEPAIPWNDVAGMRDQLAHRYFDTAHSIVAATVDHDLPPLVAAVQRLLENPGRVAAYDRLTRWAPRSWGLLLTRGPTQCGSGGMARTH